MISKIIPNKQFKNYPLLGALIAQVMSLVLIKLFIEGFSLKLTSISYAIIQGFTAALISQIVFKLPKWFLTISLLFPFLFLLAFKFIHFSNTVYGVLFLFFALTFSHTFKERVPLYLTNQKTYEALKKILALNNASTFLDLGSGLGGVVRSLSSLKVKSIGVESAPLLWGLSSLLSMITLRGKILRKNIWDTNLGEYDVVYAFLSPAIMTKLYFKVKKEMKKGSLFVSNSFEVDGVTADEIWQLDDKRETVIYFYKV